MKARDPVIIIGVLCFLIKKCFERELLLSAKVGSSGTPQPRVRLELWWLLENLIKSKEWQDLSLEAGAVARPQQHKHAQTHALHRFERIG